MVCSLSEHDGEASILRKFSSSVFFPLLKIDTSGAMVIQHQPILDRHVSLKEAEHIVSVLGKFCS